LVRPDFTAEYSDFSFEGLGRGKTIGMKREGLIDIRGVSFRPMRRPLHIISLVPCWTETLFYLRLTEKEIVGRTDYCLHPRTRVDSIEKLGGPKDPNLRRVFELDPDLIIMDREENRKEDVELLERHWGLSRVFATGPQTVSEALTDVEKLGYLLDARSRARLLTETVRSLVAQVTKEYRGTAVYLVWQDPLIAASKETYIGDVLDVLGHKNVFDRSTVETLDSKDSPNYPVVSIDLLVRYKPDVIFLATEPFPFRRKHISRFRARLHHLDPEYAESADIRVVNGEYFSWYGSRMIPAFRYFLKHGTHP